MPKNYGLNTTFIVLYNFNVEAPFLLHNFDKTNILNLLYNSIVKTINNPIPKKITP